MTPARGDVKEERTPFEEVVEAMARASHEWSSSKDSVCWEDEEEYDRESHRDAALTMLMAGNRTGLLKLVEERPDPACSDPNCSYRAEVSLLADECQGSGCRRRKAGEQPRGEPSEEAVRAAVRVLDPDDATIPDYEFFGKPEDRLRARAKDVLNAAYAIDHPQDREAK